MKLVGTFVLWFVRAELSSVHNRGLWRGTDYLQKLFYRPLLWDAVSVFYNTYRFWPELCCFGQLSYAETFVYTGIADHLSDI